MIILGLDTATPTASVALVDDDKLIAEEISESSAQPCAGSSPQPKGNHAEIVFPLIKKVLAQSDISLAAVSGLAVSIGPGSFTGLRIALATLKGLAYEWGVPVAGVSTLLANAARVKNHEGIICSLMDARKNEVYAAIYRRRAEHLTSIAEERVCSISAAMELVRATGSAEAVIVGDGAKRYAILLAQAFGPSARISTGDEFGSVAAQVAALSRHRLSAGEGDNLVQLMPRYLRSSEAEKNPASRL